MIVQTASASTAKEWYQVMQAARSSRDVRNASVEAVEGFCKRKQAL